MPHPTQSPTIDNKQDMAVKRILFRAIPFVIDGLVIYFFSQRESMNGYIWFLPSILASLWLATYLNGWLGALFAVVMGLVHFYSSSFDPIPISDSIGMGDLWIHPALFAIFGGELGSVLGTRVSERRASVGVSRLGWSVGLAIVGLVLGFGCGIVYLMATVG